MNENTRKELWRIDSLMKKIVSGDYIHVSEFIYKHALGWMMDIDDHIPPTLL